MELLMAETHVTRMKLFIKCTPPYQPAFWMAMVIGLCSARLGPFCRPSASAGHVSPKKNATPM